MRTTPFAHQQECYDRTRDLVEFAVWWEQGTGKSKLIVDTACHLFTEGKITGLLIVAPNGVQGNFVTQEMPPHAWVEYRGFVYDTGRASTKRGQGELERVMAPDVLCLQVMAIAYDSVKTKRGLAAAQDFLRVHRALCVLDESTAISEPRTERSKAVMTLGPLATYRRVMSGTPVAEGPFKIFNQMKFLNANYWKRHGLTSYMVFKSSFAVFRTQRAAAGHQFQQLLHYQNIDYLQKLIAEHSSRVLKEDVLDLPPKLYTKVEFEMAPKQRRIYDDLVSHLIAEIDEEHQVEAMTALVRLTRLQQITSGYVGVSEVPPPAEGDIVLWRQPDFELKGEIRRIDVDHCEVVGQKTLGEVVIAENDLEIVRLDDPALIRLVNAEPATVDLFDKPEDNPRVQALMAILEPITTKVIIWARYTRDINNICHMLGDRAVRYDGQVRTADRETALHRFRTDDTIQYFVANPATLSMGVTLTIAKTVIYYSNNFQLEKRLQSEDRAHRIGQTVSVNVIDLIAQGSVDEKIVTALRKKFSLAATVTGDRLREWIS